ncbi:hypothetical protein V8C35DRAFT_296018 [Trichoderma chlorosporum]
MKFGCLCLPGCIRLLLLPWTSLCVETSADALEVPQYGRWFLVCVERTPVIYGGGQIATSEEPALDLSPVALYGVRYS